MASWMFATASSGVSPSLMHPGRSGTVARNPPPSPGGNGSSSTEYSRRDIGTSHGVEERNQLPDIHRLDGSLEGDCQFGSQSWMRHLVVGASCPRSSTDDPVFPANRFHIRDCPVG